MKKEIFRDLLILLALLLILVWLSGLAWNRYFDPDEFEHLHASRSIARGLRVYTDFFEHHMPLQYIFLVPLHHMLNDTEIYLISGRYFYFCFLILTLVMTYLIARRMLNQTSALLALMLLTCSFVFREKAVEIRPDNILVPLFLGGLVCLLIGLDRMKNGAFIGSGMLFGLSVWSSVKAGLLIAAVGVSCLIYGIAARKIRRLFVCGICEMAGFGAILTIGILMAWKMGILKDLFHFNFIQNADWKYSFPVQRSISEIMAKDPAILALFTTAWVATGLRMTSRYRLASSEGFLFFVLTLSLAGILIFIPNPYLQNFLPAQPLLAIFGVLCLRRSFTGESPSRKWFRPFIAGWITLAAGYSAIILVRTHFFEFQLPADQVSGHWLTILMCPVIALVPFASSRFSAPVVLLLAFWPGFHLLKGNPGREFQFEKIRQIRDLAGDDGTVLDGWTGYGTLSDHAIFYPFIHIGIRNQFGKQLAEAVREVLETNPPEIIILDAGYLDKGLGLLPEIESRYRWDTDLRIWIRLKPGEIHPDTEGIIHRTNRRSMQQILRREY
ncbi:glycosyltransferase family 39 protein [bacterium]|nr:glycosyltransferase family 39 protein [candidate division CSSED10-310 bacterium]